MNFKTKDGVDRTPEQIEAAFAACLQIEYAYARASEDNGGFSVVCDRDVDQAREHANAAITDAECLAIQDQAQRSNEREVRAAYEFKRPEDTEGGTCD